MCLPNFETFVASTQSTSVNTQSQNGLPGLNYRCHEVAPPALFLHDDKSLPIFPLRKSISSIERPSSPSSPMFPLSSNESSNWIEKKEEMLTKKPCLLERSTSLNDKRIKKKYLKERQRCEIVRRVCNGEKQAHLAKEFGVSRAAVCYLLKHHSAILERAERRSPLAVTFYNQQIGSVSYTCDIST